MSETAWHIEIAHSAAPRGQFRFALFDFDGTLSLIREGWQGVMIPYFVEELLKTPRHEEPDQIERLCSAYERADLPGRKLIRTFAALSISRTEGIPTRRYTP